MCALKYGCGDVKDKCVENKENLHLYKLRNMSI